MCPANASRAFPIGLIYQSETQCSDVHLTIHRSGNINSRCPWNVHNRGRSRRWQGRKKYTLLFFEKSKRFLFDSRHIHTRARGLIKHSSCRAPCSIRSSQSPKLPNTRRDKCKHLMRGYRSNYTMNVLCTASARHFIITIFLMDPLNDEKRNWKTLVCVCSMLRLNNHKQKHGN